MTDGTHASGRVFEWLRRAGALAALVVAGAASATPLSDGGSSNVWVADEEGHVTATYTVGTYGWSVLATPSGASSVTVQLEDGTVATKPAGPVVLLNKAQSSLPPLDPALPPLSLKGLEKGLTQSLKKPSIQIRPPGGRYDKTIPVLLEAVPAPRGNGPVHLEWSVYFHPKGSLGSGETSTWSTEDGDATARFFLAKDGRYRITATAYQNDLLRIGASSPKTVWYTLAAEDGVRRDEDGDGVPDVVEVAIGHDPFVSDASQDRDGDGWSDLEEFLRDPDLTALDDPTRFPADLDSDGWSDWDEEHRGTRIDDVWEYPRARRLTEVEHILSGTIYADSAMTPQTNMGELSALDAYWNELYHQRNADALEGQADPAALPPDLRKMEVDAALLAGNLPPFLRVAAGEYYVVRAIHLVDGEPDAWVAKASVPASPDPDPAAFLRESGASWTTAEQWRTEYIDFLDQNLVQHVQVDLSPVTGIRPALLEAAVAWYAELSPGALLLLGNEDSPQPRSAVEALVEALSAEVDVLGGEELQAGRTLGDLEQQIVDTLQDLGSYAGLETRVEGFYADPGGLSEPSTTHATAALLQKAPLAEADVVYLVRLLVAIPDPDPALIQNPDADYDGDGISNRDELAGTLGQRSDPRSPNTDGDSLPDGADPCPADPGNVCLALVDLEGDLDGDGVKNALDVCPNDADPLQTDTNGNGIGDACARYANIRTPVSNVTVYAGAPVHLTSIRNDDVAFSDPLTFSWDLGGGAPDSNAPDPGDVLFATPGSYTIRLTVTDSLGTTSPLGPDVRVVTVLDSGLSLDVGGPYAAIEGRPVSLAATARGLSDPVAIQWDFGDGEAGAGDLVLHTYENDGVYPVGVTATSQGTVLRGETEVVAADTDPAVDFDYESDGLLLLPGTPVRFQDLSRPVADPIAFRVWSFGDGSPGTGESAPVHAFASQGVFPVVLTVSDDDGSAASLRREVHIASGFELLPDVEPDGMADAWEVAHGLEIGTDDGAADPDRDGASNRDEFRLGTDPHHADSAPAMRAGGDSVLFLDRFDEASLSERWSVGLQSPTAASRYDEEGGLHIALDSGGDRCASSGLVSLASLDALDVRYRMEATRDGGGTLCLGLARGDDLRNAVELCSVEADGAFAVRLRSASDGVKSEVGAPASVAGAWSAELLRQGDRFTLVQMGLPAGVLVNASLRDAAVRPYIRSESCPEDANPARDRVDRVEIIHEKEKGKPK